MPHHLVRIGVNESRVRVSACRWRRGGRGQWLVIGDRNDVISGIVSNLVGAIAMRAALRNCRADRLNDLQIVRRCRIHVGHAHHTVAVAGPQLLARSHQHAARSLTIGERGGGVGVGIAPCDVWTRKTGNSADKQVVLRIDNVDAKV